MSDQEEEKRSFLFDWEPVLVACLQRKDDETSIGIFSRVYLEDWELLNLGADDKVAAATEKSKKLKIQLTRRQWFLLKIQELGYAHSFNIDQELDICASQPESRSMADEFENEGGRIAIRYDDLDYFTDVKFQAFTPSLQPKRTRYNFKRDIPIISDENILDEETTAVYNLNFEEENKIDIGIDFGFDPVRDAKLVAKDANKLLKNDKQVMKYWFQRYRLFSKLNHGILMDREGWFSVTPERIAEHIADRMANRNCSVILDAFTGVGGNAIQFALRGAYVYAIDIDPIRLRCATRNAEIYGVSKQITFICGDFFNIAKSFFGSRVSAQIVDASEDAEGKNNFGIDSVFLSPPWGGPSYHDSNVYDLEFHIELNGKEIYNVSRRISPNICYFLPKKTSINQLISLAGPGGKVEIEQNILNGKIKTICAYYGNLVSN